MRRHIYKTAALFAIVALFVPGVSRAVDTEPHGRMAISSINISDTLDTQSFSATTLYYRYIQEGLLGEDKLSFNLDGAARFSNNDYNDGIPGGRVIMANLKYRKLADFADITIGRSFVEEFVSEMVDGVNAKIWLNNKNGFGLFGGARPDPYHDSFNTDYNAYGGYIFTRTDEFGASGGYAYDTYKGNKDRERANAFIYFMPAMEGFHFQASVDMDNVDEEADGSSKIVTKGWDMTNALAQLNWRVSKAFVLSATYNEFRAINREASHTEWKVELLEDKYRVARLRGETGIWKTLSLYAGTDYRYREADGKSAPQSYVGLRDTNFIFDTRWDIRYSDLDYFTSKVQAVYASIGVTLFEKFNADAAVTWMKNTQDGQMGGLDQMVYELNMDYAFTRNIYAVLSWQYSSEKYLDINSIYSTRYADNFNTTTMYGQVGYRF
ncbi:MAG: hypothetical protein HZB29_04060 [Nitrospinae bacterium]|nr:hypothetical protein [Nitrospinota bacterium]